MVRQRIGCMGCVDCRPNLDCCQVPIYALHSWASYYWYRQALYFQLIRDCYESVVIASFFSLLLYYLGDTEEEHADVFRQVQFKNWMWPFGRVRYRPTGIYFLTIVSTRTGYSQLSEMKLTRSCRLTDEVDYRAVLDFPASVHDSRRRHT